MQRMQKVSLSLRVLILSLLLVFIWLQARLWLSEDGWSQVIQLRASVAEQGDENARLTERNSRLQAEVADLKSGFAALEERARRSGHGGRRREFLSARAGD